MKKFARSIQICYVNQAFYFSKLLHSHELYERTDSPKGVTDLFDAMLRSPEFLVAKYLAKHSCLHWEVRLHLVKFLRNMVHVNQAIYFRELLN